MSISDLKVPPPIPPRKTIAIQDLVHHELQTFVERLRQIYSTFKIDNFTSEKFKDSEIFEQWKNKLIQTTKNPYVFNDLHEQEVELKHFLTDIGFYHNNSEDFDSLSTTDRHRLTQACFQAAANLPHIEVLVPEFAAANIHQIDVDDFAAFRGYLTRIWEYQFYLAQKLSLCENLEQRALWINILKTLIVHDGPVQEDMGELMNKLGSLYYIYNIPLDFAVQQCKRLFTLLSAPLPVSNDDRSFSYDRQVMSDIIGSLREVIQKLKIEGEPAQLKIAQIVELINSLAQNAHQECLSKEEIQKLIAAYGCNPYFY
jgi:hypothetical protein